MDIKELIKKENDIKSRIIERAKNGCFDKGYILDGVADIEKYFKRKPKIAWILKEAWDKDWGEWDICNEVIIKQDTETISGTPSFKRVAYVSYGIVRNLLWDDMPWIYQDEDIVDALKSVAWLNISKIAGDSKSPDARIQNAYDNWSDILKEQLDLYDPDIIILGNTYKWVNELLEIDNVCPVKIGTVYAYRSRQNKIVIWAFHPSCRKKDQVYIDDIIQAVNILA